MKETLTIRIERKLLEFLRTEAKKDFRNLNNYVEMVLTKYMQENKQQKNQAD